MKAYVCLRPTRLRSASLLAVLAAGFLLSTATTAIAGPGPEYWKNLGKPKPSAVPNTNTPAAPGTSMDCNSCKIIDVKRVVPSANGRFQQTVAEKKAVCSSAKDAAASSCCAPNTGSAPAKTDTHGT
jgi:hypothetical protein